MKIELSIRDDKELRNVIKDMIRGQIMALIREDIEKLTAAEVERKFKAGALDYTMEVEIRRNLPERLSQRVDTIIKEALSDQVEQGIITKCEEKLTGMRSAIEEIVIKTLNKAKFGISK